MINNCMLMCFYFHQKCEIHQGSIERYLEICLFTKKSLLTTIYFQALNRPYPKNILWLKIFIFLFFGWVRVWFDLWLLKIRPIVVISRILHSIGALCAKSWRLAFTLPCIFTPK